MKTPIAVFTYRRGALARAALESLFACDRLAECELFVFADGPKHPKDDAAVRENRRMVREAIHGRQVTLIERTANWGLARSIAGAVTELCDSHGRVVVIEDDLVVSPDFLHFVLEALDRYADEPSVMHVNGFRWPRSGPERTALVPAMASTGWATWSRAWRRFQWDTTEVEALLHDPAELRRFNLEGAYRYDELLRRQRLGEIDSWGIHWWCAMFLARGLSVLPPRSLVHVGGFGEGATHTGHADTGHNAEPVSAFRTPRLPAGWTWPDLTATDAEVFAGYQEHVRAMSAPRPAAPPPPLLRRAVRWALRRAARILGVLPQ